MFVLQMCLFAAKVTCMYTKDDTQIVQVLGLNSGSGCFYSVASCSIFTCVSISLIRDVNPPVSLRIRSIGLGFYRIPSKYSSSWVYVCVSIVSVHFLCVSLMRCAGPWWKILICGLIGDGPWWHTHVCFAIVVAWRNTGVLERA